MALRISAVISSGLRPRVFTSGQKVMVSVFLRPVALSLVSGSVLLYGQIS